MNHRTLFPKSLMTIALMGLLWAPVAHSEPPVIVPVPVSGPLQEAPVHPLSEKMTFEEYEDMNRTLFQGFLYSGIPGGWHFYAGERKTGWILAGTVAAGLGLVIAGASMIEETEDWEESDYGTVDISGQRFERIPVGRTRTGDDVQIEYKLRELNRKREDNGGGALVGLGAAAILGAYIYDFFGGIDVIESKRRKVRYKYGQDLRASVALDPRTGQPRLSMRLSF